MDSRHKTADGILFSNSGEMAFLSPFYEYKNGGKTPIQIIINGESYRTVEHYYQSQKAASDVFKKYIREAPDPETAHDVGHYSVTGDKMVPDWEERKVEVMRTAILARFRNVEALKHRLLATGDAALYEDTDDPFWGYKGKNMLGKLLMEAREQIRAESDLEKAKR
jgi:hypothetical protein